MSLDMHPSKEEEEEEDPFTYLQEEEEDALSYCIRSNVIAHAA
jgi:hypothetical protein